MKNNIQKILMVAKYNINYNIVSIVTNRNNIIEYLLVKLLLRLKSVSIKIITS